MHVFLFFFKFKKSLNYFEHKTAAVPLGYCPKSFKSKRVLYCWSLVSLLLGGVCPKSRLNLGQHIPSLESISPKFWSRDSSAGGGGIPWKRQVQCWHRFYSSAQQGIFSPQVSFQCRLFQVSTQCPCAVTCINICEHTQNSKHWQPCHCLDTQKILRHTLIGMGSAVTWILNEGWWSTKKRKCLFLSVWLNLKKKKSVTKGSLILTGCRMAYHNETKINV